MIKTTVIYLPEGFADWEGAFIMPELKEVNWVQAEENIHALKMACDFLNKGILVAGICGATVALARSGSHARS